MSILKSSQWTADAPRAPVEGMPDLVFRISSVGHFLDMHAPREHSLLDLGHDFLGMHVERALPKEMSAPLLACIGQVIADEVPRAYECQLEVGRRLLDYEVRVVPVTNRDVLALVRDVSERKMLDLMKDEFISTVSHELRTPLAAIHGALGLLSAGVLGTLERAAREVVEAALGNSKRLGRLVNDILDLDRVSRSGLALELRPMVLAPLVERAVAESAVYAAEYHVTYVVDPSEQEARAIVDRDRLMQVIQNLLSNAAKYGNPQDEVHVGCVRGTGGLRIYVRNRGAPIPTSFRGRMFTRFAVLDGTDMRARQGTGLGLAIAKGLVEKMNGTIDFVSTVEVTEFFVTLPECGP